MILITKQRLVNLNFQNNKLIVKIIKSKWLDQDTGDGPRPNHYGYVEILRSAAWFDDILREIGNQICECRWIWKPLNGM